MEGLDSILQAAVEGQSKVVQSYIVAWLTFIIVMAFVYFISYRIGTRKTDDRYEQSKNEAIAGLIFIIGLIFAIILAFLMKDIYLRLYAPEYVAVKEIAKYIEISGMR